MARTCVLLTAILVLICPAIGAQVAVSMSQYDAGRTGANLEERILKPSNVNPDQFGRLFQRKVDDSVYALPLIIPGVTIDGSRRNLLLVATMGNTVYAFDADDARRPAPYWSRKLGAPSAGNSWIGPTNWGVLGAPVVDLDAGVVYLVAKSPGQGGTSFLLHALDLSDGRPRYNSPQRLSFHFEGGPTRSTVPHGIQRAGLVLADDSVVVAFAGIRENASYNSQEGFLQSFDAKDLSLPPAAFQVTPDGLKGGVWQAGRGIATDGKGYVYVATAGGSYDGAADFGSSVLKLSARDLELTDWFTPRNHEFLFRGNLDPSANGVTLIPNSSLMFAGGKDGVIYLLDQSDLGRLEGPDSGPLQRFKATRGCGPIDCAQSLGTAFWSRGEEGLLYVWDRRDRLRSYRYTNQQRFETTPWAVSTVRPEMTGGPALSANGTGLESGIVWAVTVDSSANDSQVPGTLRAFRAADVSNELYSSDIHPARDSPGDFTKFAPPVIANGKVYVVTQSGVVSVYGLLARASQDGAVSSVVNSADYTPRLAGHSLTSVFGEDLSPETCGATDLPLPKQLCGVSVEVTDPTGSQAPAPLMYVSPDQINLQMPVTGFSTGNGSPNPQVSQSISGFGDELCVQPANACAAITVHDQAPAIFTYERLPGVSDPILTHVDGVLVSPTRPAAPGETLILYATGFGYPDDRFPPDGEPAPADQLFELDSASVVVLTTPNDPDASEPLPASFVGLAPGFVGVYQINFTLPAVLGQEDGVSIRLQGPTEGQSQTLPVHME